MEELKQNFETKKKEWDKEFENGENKMMQQIYKMHDGQDSEDERDKH